MSIQATEALVARSEALAALAEACSEIELESADARERVRRLRDHLRTFVLPRAASLDAPLVVLLFGPTGAGKSSLANAIAGRPVSPTGVLRPTTREAILLATSGDRAALDRGPLAGLSDDELGWHRVAWEPGVAVVDSPDIDSVETANRALAERLVEAADVAIFVTTATRYADRVPWNVLRRVAERRLPLLVVVNRLPPDRAQRAEVLDDVARLLGESALVGADAAAQLTIVPVVEGELEADGASIARAAAGPVVARLEALRTDADARRALAARSLAGALAGLEPLLRSIADDLEREAIDADALRRAADAAFRSERAALRDELRSGSFLRAEVLRRWQDFVGADRLTRTLSSGLGRVEARLRSLVHGGDAPVTAVRNETRTEIAGLAEAHASEASRRAAAAWQDAPLGRRLLEREPDLWTASPDLRERLSADLDAWLESIRAAIASTGEPKRRLALGAATGVNAAGVGVMLAVFLHTGGLTGAEMGVAAGTALVNQRLLQAIFGEAAMSRLVEGAARRLDDLLDYAFGSEAGRFLALAPAGDLLRDRATSLRVEADWAAGLAHDGPGDASDAADVGRPSVEIERGRAGLPIGSGARSGLAEALRRLFLPGRSRG